MGKGKMGGGDATLIDDEFLKTMEKAAICTECGTQYPPELGNPPASCPMCTDDRQFVPKHGQQWTSLDAMKFRSSYRNAFYKYEEGVYALMTCPDFALAQRSFLVQTPEGNILWDCLSYIDEATVDIIKALGGVRAIAISHPHYYATNIHWTTAFGGIPVYIHDLDKKWIAVEHGNYRVWIGDTLKLFGGLTMIRLGGHFPGGYTMHHPTGAGGKGILFSSDILMAGRDRKSVSIMRSFPQHVPLSAAHALRIGKITEKLQFEKLFSSFWDLEVPNDAKNAVIKSLRKYIKWLHNDDPEE